MQRLFEFFFPIGCSLLRKEDRHFFISVVGSTRRCSLRVYWRLLIRVFSLVLLPSSLFLVSRDTVHVRDSSAFVENKKNSGEQNKIISSH